MESQSRLVASLAEEARCCLTDPHDALHITLCEEYPDAALYLLDYLVQRGTLVDGDLVLPCNVLEIDIEISAIPVVVNIGDSEDTDTKYYVSCML